MPIIPTTRVYPRACGGTDTAKPDADGGTGLSPRVRGNLMKYPKI